METYVATRRNRLTGEEYQALCTRLGFNEMEVALFEGRPCIILGEFRRRAFRGSNVHTRYQVRFLDDNEHRTIPAGMWAKKARVPPLPA